MRLNDYHKLAFEFAIRNPRVIELLHMDLIDDVAKELLTFGINIKCDFMDENGSHEYNSLEWINLDYNHLSDIKHLGISREKFGGVDDTEAMAEYQKFISHGLLIHPNANDLSTEEEFEDAAARIKGLIESRGKKLKRLMNGKAFEHYDAVIFFGETIYSLDPSKNTAKTIASDIAFISEWIHPDKYLQLIPQHFSFLD